MLLFPALALGTTLGNRGPGSVSFGCKRCRHSLTAQAPGCIVCCWLVRSMVFHHTSCNGYLPNIRPGKHHPGASFCWLKLQWQCKRRWEALSVTLAPAGIRTRSFMATNGVRTFSLKIRARPNAQKLTAKLWLNTALHLLNGTWRTKRSGKHSVCPI